MIGYKIYNPISKGILAFCFCIIFNVSYCHKKGYYIKTTSNC